MVEAVMLWNEPNNLSHWDFKTDPDWKMFARTAIAGAKAVRRVNPDIPIVLGGISPIDPGFMRALDARGVLAEVDAVAVHGLSRLGGWHPHRFWATTMVVDPQMTIKNRRGSHG